jgi:endonuclease-3
VDRNLKALRDLLVAEGEVLLNQRPRGLSVGGDKDAAALINDLKFHPHAFLFGCLVDRQVRAERAWKVPATIRERLGSFEVADLHTLTEAQWLKLMRKPSPAHRLPEAMATVLFRATDRIVHQYEGDASLIWKRMPESATVVRRFLEFYGAGPKIATMATNILVRNFHVPLSDHRYIDISADVQVRRVMARLGFVNDGSNAEIVTWAARELNPHFPGIFDLPLWEIGREVCRPKIPLCGSCRMNRLCAYSIAAGKAVEMAPRVPRRGIPT